MRLNKKAKNAELQGLRFSISFSQMRNELRYKGTTLFWNNKQKCENNFAVFNNLLIIYHIQNKISCPALKKIRISKYDFAFSEHNFY